MKQVRLNTFETNSSSSHSFVITDFEGRYSQEEIMNHVYLSKDGKVIMWESRLEFGRSPFDFLNTFESKTRYAIASSNGRLVPQIVEVWKKYVPRFSYFEFDEKYRVWDEKKQEYVDTDEDNPVYEYGYTDDSMIEAWLKKYNVSVEDFLTMKRYIIVVDGDEYLIKDKIFNSGLMDTSHIIHDSYAEYEEALSKAFEEERNNENH
jgi:hypothetical protein